MEEMDDDFLTEHVLPLMSRSNVNDDLDSNEVPPISQSSSSNLFTCAQFGMEMTMNALSDHVDLTSRYFNNTLLSDVRLKIGSDVYHAHKFILAKSSDVFATLLYSQHWTSAEEIILEEEHECQGDIFEKFLKFFYTAKITLNEVSVIGVLCLADKYNVQALRQLCAQFMIIKAKSPNVRNGITWYPIAKQFGLDELRDACMKTVSWNIEYLFMPENQNEWIRCDFDFVRDLLVTSNLVVADEYRLYLSLTAWLQVRISEPSWLSYTSELLPLIRFSQMLPMQLHQIEESQLFQRCASEDIAKLFQRLLYQAYRFHTLARLKRGDNKPDFLPLDWYSPREYTEMNITDRVDIQSTLRFGIQVDVQTCSSPVPSTERTADWKVVYRKRSKDKWTLKIHRHDEALETAAQITAIIYNSQRQVLQVERGETFVFTTSNQYELEIVLDNPYEAKELYLLIKPVLPYS